MNFRMAGGILAWAKAARPEHPRPDLSHTRQAKGWVTAASSS
jgi:hypothetical protein